MQKVVSEKEETDDGCGKIRVRPPPRSWLDAAVASAAAAAAAA